MRLRLVPLLALVALAGCGGSKQADQTLTIAVNGSFSKNPYVAETIAHGAQLAVLELPQGGLLTVGSTTYKLQVKKYDTAGSPVRVGVPNGWRLTVPASGSYTPLAGQDLTGADNCTQHITACFPPSSIRTECRGKT